MKKVRNRTPASSASPTAQSPEPEAKADTTEKRLIKLAHQMSPAYQRYLRTNHGSGIAGHVYEKQTSAFASGDFIQGTATEFAEDFMRRLNPRDPLEELLAFQALWTHGRLGRLSYLANQQESIKNVQVINDACDRASNTFRRQMLALAEYRNPKKAGNFTAIGQANIAQQQVIQNEQTSTKKEANEQGSLALGASAHEAPALPAHTGRADSPPLVSPTAQALAPEYRP